MRTQCEDGKSVVRLVGVIPPSCVMGIITPFVGKHFLCNGMRAWQRALSSGQVAASVPALFSSMSKGQRDTLCWLTPRLCPFLQKKKLKRQREAEEDELEIPPRYQGEVAFLFVGQFPFTCIRLGRCREGGRVMKLHSLDTDYSGLGWGTSSCRPERT